MFKIGDRVKYGPRSHEAKVIRVIPYSNEYIIEFEDKNLIPPQMTVSGDDISPILEKGYSPWYSGPSDSYVNKETNCPRCGNKWTETWIGHKPFYDCIKCNLKKEDA